MSLKITPFGINNTGLIIGPFGFVGDGTVDSGGGSGGGGGGEAATTTNVYLGSNALTNVYVGSTEITAIYKGSTLVWGS